MTAESELLFVAEGQISQQFDEAHEVQPIGHSAYITNAPLVTNKPRPSEKTPLIFPVSGDVVVGLEVVNDLDQHAGEAVDADQNASISALAQEEATGVFRLAVPFAGAQAVEVLPMILFGVLIGNIAGAQSASVLAASALSDFFQAQVVYNLAGGLGSALETVGAQSFGAKQYAQLCLYAQAGLIAVAYSTPVLVFLSLNSASLFQLLGQDPRLAAIAAVFTSMNAISLPFISLFVVAKSVLVSQHIATPFVVIPIAANALALPIAYALGYYTRLGYVGVAIGMVVPNVAKFVMVLPFVFKSPAFAAGAWPGFQWREAHELMWRLVPLGTSSILMVTFQALGLNVVSILCGYLPDVAQSMAANGIAGALFSLAIVPAVGVFVSGCIRVGTALGAGKARRAAIAGVVGAATTLAVAVGSALVSACLIRSFAHGFTQDTAVAEAATSLYARILPTIPLLGGMLGLQGILRACGRQWLIAMLSFVFLFVLGVPAGLLLAITCGLGVQGLWYGQMLGLLGCSVASAVVVYRLDWHEIAAEAYRNTHVHVDREPVPEPPTPSEAA